MPVPVTSRTAARCARVLSNTLRPISSSRCLSLLSSPRTALALRLLHSTPLSVPSALPRPFLRGLTSVAADGSVVLPPDEHSEAFEVIPSSRTPCPILITCEHASSAMPDPYSLPSEDSALAGTHWQSDLGAADLARDLCAALPAPGILSRVSRLVVDVNRPLQSDTLMRATADGRPIALNRGVDPHAFEDRVSRFYLPYHRRLQQLVRTYRPQVVLSVHSFTPEYEGSVRRVEVGVLYRRAKDEPHAKRLVQCMQDAGFVSGLNEPWSGLLGFMYAMDSLTTGHPTAAPVLAPPFTTAVTPQPSTRLEPADSTPEQRVLKQAAAAESPAAGAPAAAGAASAAPSTSGSESVWPEVTLMLECRQDLLVHPAWRSRCVKAIASFLRSIASTSSR